MSNPLFSPFHLGPLTLPNRVVMAPMTRSRAGEGDVPTDLAAAYYAQRATAGLIGTTFVFCLPGSRGACRDAWEGILSHQLDYRHSPCNFVELMPRLSER